MTLQAIDLAIGYPGRTVGTGFTLTLRAGEVMALLGPNGSGKTTLLKTLLGLLPARGGRVELEGRALDSHSSGDRARRLAYVPQAPGGGFGFTVRESVLMGRTAHGGLFSGPSSHDRALVDAAIERMGITALADQPTTRISGGERQLALIARALAQQARVVVLDEPTANLDFGNQGKVMREIRRLADEGLGVLFTTHDPNHALRFADIALLIRDGRPLASGPAPAVIDGPRLQALYGSPVLALRDTLGGGQAFLPT